MLSPILLVLITEYHKSEEDEHTKQYDFTDCLKDFEHCFVVSGLLNQFRSNTVYTGSPAL